MSNEENKTEIEYEKNGEKKKVVVDLSTLTKPPKELEVEVDDSEKEALKQENEQLKDALSTIAEKELEAKKKALGLSGKIDDLPIDEQIPIVKYEEMKRFKGNEPEKPPIGGTTLTWEQNVSGKRESEKQERVYDTNSLEDMHLLKSEIDDMLRKGQLTREQYNQLWKSWYKSAREQKDVELELSTVEDMDDKGRKFKKLDAKLVPKSSED